MFYPKATKDLQTALAAAINEAEAELTALKSVAIDTKHKTLTNRAITGGRIGDYLNLGKALYVGYKIGYQYKTFDMIAYTYENPDGIEIGTVGFLRMSRTMTPLELKAGLDKAITGREASLNALKLDLASAKKIVTKYNKLSASLDELLQNTTYATRGFLK